MKPEHNGRSGRVIAALDVTSGRYGVEPDDGATRLSLKPANVRRRVKSDSE